jgi:hypothetical protein
VLLYIVTSGNCCDKNNQVAEMSLKLLARLIENIGGSIIYLSPPTLQTLMKNLSLLAEGKRQNLHNQALDICLYIFNLMGRDNFLNLMNFSLNQQEIQMMGQTMEMHRVAKQKHVPLADVLKKRRDKIPQKNMQNMQNSCENFNYSNLNGQQWGQLR